MKKPFQKWSLGKQVSTVRRLMKDGHSNKSAAKELGVKPGVIAGIRWRNKIPSTHPPAFEVGFTKLAKSAGGRVLKLAPPGPTQCEANVDGHRCAYLKVLGSDYCGLPTHQALAKKKRSR